MSNIKVVILSGIPGAGKGSWVEENRDNVDYIVSADDYFMVNGEYKYNYQQIQEAHNSCLKKFVEYIQHVPATAQAVIVVDNTNTTSEEIAPYYAIAKAYGAEVALLTFTCSAEVSAARNLHGVPLKSSTVMEKRLAKRILPAHWQINCVFLLPKDKLK